MNQKAFTLVELMVTIIIIGILAAVAGVGYQKYILQARLAEAYVGIDAFTKNHLSYYAEEKRFHYIDNNPSRVPSGGKKIPIEAAPSWKNAGYPLALGTLTEFTFMSVSGKNDKDGQPITTPYDAPSGTQLALPSYQYRLTLDTPTWTVNEDMISTGLEDSAIGKPNYSWSFINVVANLKINPSGVYDQVTEFRRIVDTDENGTVRSGPIVQLHIGE